MLQQVGLLFVGLVVLTLGIYGVRLFIARVYSSSSGLAHRTLYIGTSVLLCYFGMRLTIASAESIAVLRGFNRWNRLYRVRISREAAGYLLILFVLLVGAAIGRNNMLMLVFGLMAGPFVVNGGITLSTLRRTSARRKLPERIMAGDRFSVEVEISNKKRWLSSWILSVKDRIVGSSGTLEGGVLFPRVRPQEQRYGRYEVCLTRRGRYEFGPLHITSRFPMGLMERTLVKNQFQSMLVYPRLGRLTHEWRDRANCAGEVLHPQTRKGDYDDEFHRLREYRPGDNPRSIHWRTSARRQQLMVSEYHEHHQQDLLVILDLWAPVQADDGQADAGLAERVELAVSFAATLCVDHSQGAGDAALLLGINGATPASQAGPKIERSLIPALEALAVAETGVNDRLAELLRSRDVEQSTASRRVLITITSEADEGAAPARRAAGADLSKYTVIFVTPASLQEFMQWEAAPA